MAVGLQLGIQQFTVNGKLETPSIGRNQGDRFNIRLKFVEQFSCQTGSAADIVSDNTVDQVDFQ
jgi:hypothetical protein